MAQNVSDVLKISFPNETDADMQLLSNTQFLDQCLSFFEQDDVMWWILLVHDELVAVCISVLMLKEYFLYNLCTKPSHRRRGYAKHLLFEIQSHAMDNGAIGFKGNVNLDNLGAIAFYTKYGACKDTNFARSDSANPPTSMRLLYRWKKSIKTRQEIEQQQKSVWTAYEWRTNRPQRLKKSVILITTAFVSYLIFKNVKRSSKE